jgi:hypothetical protein
MAELGKGKISYTGLGEHEAESAIGFHLCAPLTYVACLPSVGIWLSIIVPLFLRKGLDT